ncbi:MAG: hypothetical protein JO089_09520 [Alphaproteobacteria bacterium]|nr:hypothetical protein [Alphaproteobacteria bacterium]
MADATHITPVRANGHANGNGHNGNGNGHRRALRNFGAESLGFMVAEGVSMAVGLGVVGVLDQIMPGTLNSAATVVSKYAVEPHLETIEGFIQKICKLEECQPDESVNREKRAHNLAKNAVVFAASLGAALFTKIQTRRLMNNAFGIVEAAHTGPWWKRMFSLSKKEAAIFAADEGVHLSLLGWMNTSQIGSEYNDNMIHATTQVLTKALGVPRDKAHELAFYGINWELPNLAGVASGLSMIGLTHSHPHWFEKAAPPANPRT